MRKRVFISLLIIGLSLFFTACGKSGTNQKAKDTNGKLIVYTSIYVLEDFAKKIGGKHVEVRNLVPVGVEPHDYEPSTKDLLLLQESDVFLYNGSGMETWVEKTLSNLAKEKTLVVNTTEKLQLLKRTEQGHGHKHGGESSHHNDSYDPHVWLDPTLAKQQALQIRNAFIQKDPEHRVDYETNYADLERKLTQLDQEFMDMVKVAPKKEFVTSHDAFQYLSKRYGLTQIAISGISPQDEPSPRELKEIVEIARKHQVKYILFETLVSSKVADVVRNEMKAEALVLNPLEGLTKEEQAQGDDYFSIMRKNKENLAKSLGVKP